MRCKALHWPPTLCNPFNLTMKPAGPAPTLPEKAEYDLPALKAFLVKIELLRSTAIADREKLLDSRSWGTVGNEANEKKALLCLLSLGIALTGVGYLFSDRICFLAGFVSLGCCFCLKATFILYRWLERFYTPPVEVEGADRFKEKMERLMGVCTRLRTTIKKMESDAREHKERDKRNDRRQRQQRQQRCSPLVPHSSMDPRGSHDFGAHAVEHASTSSSYAGALDAESSDSSGATRPSAGDSMGWSVVAKSPRRAGSRSPNRRGTARTGGGVKTGSGARAVGEKEAATQESAASAVEAAAAAAAGAVEVAAAEAAEAAEAAAEEKEAASAVEEEAGGTPSRHEGAVSPVDISPQSPAETASPPAASAPAPTAQAQQEAVRGAWEEELEEKAQVEQVKAAAEAAEGGVAAAAEEKANVEKAKAEAQAEAMAEALVEAEGPTNPAVRGWFFRAATALRRTPTPTGGADVWVELNNTRAALMRSEERVTLLSSHISQLEKEIVKLREERRKPKGDSEWDALRERASTWLSRSPT